MTSIVDGGALWFLINSNPMPNIIRACAAIANISVKLILSLDETWGLATAEVISKLKINLGLFM